MYILIATPFINGASNQTHHYTKKDVRKEIKSWDDPANLKIKVLNKEDGKIIYEGNALNFN